MYEKGKQYKAIIPYPDGGFDGIVDISATFCFFTPVSAEHPSSYSNLGLEAKFYRTNSNGKHQSDSSFFRVSKIYEDKKYLSEKDLRKDFHKWETTVKGELLNKRGNSVVDPYFTIKHFNNTF